MSVIIGWMRSTCIPSGSRIAFFVALFLVIAPFYGSAAEDARRKVLVLYDSQAGQSATANIVFAGFQTVLNYYGIITDYHDVNDGALPDDRRMQPYRGVIVTFGRIDPRLAKRYLSWLDRQFAERRRVVVLASLSIAGEAGRDAHALLERIYQRLGIAKGGKFIAAPRLIRYAYKDPRMVEFERRYPALPPIYDQFTVTGKGVVPHLLLERTDLKDSRSAVILTSPSGGFAVSEYINWKNIDDNRRKWYLNPFFFMEKALGLSNMPAPDPTTLSGLRVGFSHVDADGFSGASRVVEKQTCAEVMRDRVFRKVPFPITVSVIVAEIDPRLARTDLHFNTARDIYRLSNIEPASHSYSHPYYWSDTSENKQRYREKLGIKVPGYTFNDKTELDDSVSYITTKLAPPGKPCRVFQWTGECRPVENQVARLDAIKVLNINGGDTVYDDIDNSLFGVEPLYRQVGRRTQVHIGQANDNIFTNNLEGPFYGYRHVITTMQRTGTPRRLKPVNVYYHFFSAEQNALLRAVQDVYGWALKQELAPLYTSQYLKMMQGFMSASIKSEAPGRISVSNYGECTTVRLPQDAMTPDMEKSVNVLGYNRTPQGLYVTLERNRQRALIVLQKTASPGRSPHVQKATGFVSGFSRVGRSVRLSYEGFGREGRVVLGGMAAGAEFRISGSAAGAVQKMLRADANGILEIKGMQSGVLEVAKK